MMNDQEGVGEIGKTRLDYISAALSEDHQKENL